MFKSLLRWFADMRRRLIFGRYGSNVAVVTPTPAPTPSAAALIFNVATNSQYVPVISF